MNKYTHIRLVSLKSWSFSAKDETESFKGILAKVDAGPLQFRVLPKTEASPDKVKANPLPPPDLSEAEGRLAEVLQAGYVAMNHHLQEGHKTLSWYRGPFAPGLVEKTITTPVASAKDLICFHDETGLLNISYAAAWQLGRLLALQNKHFATALYNWKRANKQTVVRLLEKAILAESLDQAMDLNEAALQDIKLTPTGLSLLLTPQSTR